MPGKAEVTRARYLEAFTAAVEIFGKGQVSTYLLAGLGDTLQSLHEAARVLINLGVYPFIVPFVPVNGTPLATHRPPSTEFMRSVLGPVGQWLKKFGFACTSAASQLANIEEWARSYAKDATIRILHI